MFLPANHAIPQQLALTWSPVSIIASSSMSSRRHSSTPFHSSFTTPHSHFCIDRRSHVRTSRCTVNSTIQMLLSTSTSASRTAHHPRLTIPGVNLRRSSLPSCSGWIRLISLTSELQKLWPKFFFSETFPNTFARGHPPVLVTTLSLQRGSTAKHPSVAAELRMDGQVTARAIAYAAVQVCCTTIRFSQFTQSLSFTFLSMMPLNGRPLKIVSTMKNSTSLLSISLKQTRRPKGKLPPVIF